MRDGCSVTFADTEPGPAGRRVISHTYLTDWSDGAELKALTYAGCRHTRTGADDRFTRTDQALPSRTVKKALNSWPDRLARHW